MQKPYLPFLEKKKTSHRCTSKATVISVTRIHLSKGHSHRN